MTRDDMNSLCSTDYGGAEGEKFTDDILSTYELEIQVW